MILPQQRHGVYEGEVVEAVGDALRTSSNGGNHSHSHSNYHRYSDGDGGVKPPLTTPPPPPPPPKTISQSLHPPMSPASPQSPALPPLVPPPPAAPYTPAAPSSSASSSSSSGSPLPPPLPRVLSEGMDRWADIEIEGGSGGDDGMVGGGGGMGGGDDGMSDGVGRLIIADSISCGRVVEDGVPGERVLLDGVDIHNNDKVLESNLMSMTEQRRGNIIGSIPGGSPPRLTKTSTGGNIIAWVPGGSPKREKKGDNTSEGVDGSEGDISGGGAGGSSSTSFMGGILNLRSWLRPSTQIPGLGVGQGKGKGSGLGTGLGLGSGLRQGISLGLGLDHERETFTLHPQVVGSGQGLAPGQGPGLGSGLASGPGLDYSTSGWGSVGGGASVDEGETSDDHSLQAEETDTDEGPTAQEQGLGRHPGLGLGHEPGAGLGAGLSLCDHRVIPHDVLAEETSRVWTFSAQLRRQERQLLQAHASVSIGSGIGGNTDSALGCVDDGDRSLGCVLRDGLMRQGVVAFLLTRVTAVS